MKKLEKHILALKEKLDNEDLADILPPPLF